MENIDVIILTIVVVISFVVFIVTSIREFSRMEEEPYEYEPASGPTRAALFNALSSLLEEEDYPTKKNKGHKGPIKRTISDMDSDGVHFEREKKTGNKGESRKKSADSDQKKK
ncbi:hypothetical protein [Cyclobacterium jeungdonense]|uniref:Uncharacterized protein n=1 Tax=Cyclobacterium jeungdonense TaxID=708087 RepID=A0ABT8C9E2_9BACT|nr:hypothetical protein [Cyclobacterium jeungdonense]MDN3689389.1 hypothetical protein [Cyclobacterium jeungdonense]